MWYIFYFKKYLDLRSIFPAVMSTSTICDMLLRGVQILYGIVSLFFRLFSTSGFKDDGTLESTGEPLLFVLCSYYWALFSYVVLGSTFSDRAGKV